ncbi:uncharacterized protein [Drosophila bipectinata]|nr:uncharacterized protein LOC108132242 [Drosophila bipectinata]KAH8278079.1 hypothetical protein KR026_009734 [Drosophila bipectinata]KAH8324306.1 hypothetical protein KR074_004456 [Drosophila pseudoananassae]
MACCRYYCPPKFNPFYVGPYPDCACGPCPYGCYSGFTPCGWGCC